MMKKMVKKAIVYSLLAGITQFGLNTSILEAAPTSDQIQEQQNKQQVDVTRKDATQVTPKEQMVKASPRSDMEEQRHNQVMERQINESDQALNDRQWLENQKYDKNAKQENERQYRNELEMQRHEKAIQRQTNESDKAFNDRQSK